MNPLASTFIPAKFHYDGGNAPELVVIHDMEFPQQEDAAIWCGNFFQNPDPGRTPSAHYGVDASRIVQYVEETDGAWHTPGFLQGREVNRISIGIEHAGFASFSRDTWLNPYGSAMLARSAALVADICSRYGIPIRFLDAEALAAGDTRGITSHGEITKATAFAGGHTDPGSNFPWDVYLPMVEGRGGSGLTAALGSRTMLTLLAAGALWAGWRMYNGQPVIPPGLAAKIPLLR